MALLNSTFASTVTAPVNFVLMEELLSAARKRLPYFNGTKPGSLEKAQGSASVKWRRIENLTAVTTALPKRRKLLLRPLVTDVIRFVRLSLTSLPPLRSTVTRSR
jgi:hypothetical protein